MINHIDLTTVLRRTVCGLYSNLVTRPTGAAVRAEIEELLREIGERTITVIDFSNVGLLDLSCADEIVAKLLLRYTEATDGADDAPGDDVDTANGYARLRPMVGTQTESYFYFRGIHEHHLDAIEHVLERHRLALVAELEGGEAQLVGTVEEPERALWTALRRRGPAECGELARETGLPDDAARETLDALCRRRLAMRLDDGYVAVAMGH